MGKTKHDLDEVIEAIKGSGGIKQAIAGRLGVVRNTVNNYLDRWATAREAYEQECQINLDIAESIIITNLRIQHKHQQKTGETVDTSDAKWFTTMKGRERGYAQTQRTELTGADGGDLIPADKIVDALLHIRKTDEPSATTD